MFIKDKRIKLLLEQYKPIYSLKYMLLLSSWDTETFMPSEGVTARGFSTGNIEGLIQKLFLEKDFAKALLDIDPEDKKLTVTEAMIVNRLRHKYDKYTKLPSEFVNRFAALTSTASTVWAKAKSENDFEMFKPYLEKIFTYSREAAGYLGYKENPYEALIEDYEPEMTMNDYDSYFTELQKTLSHFDISGISKIKELSDEFSIEALKGIVADILSEFRADKTFIRIDESSHPFTNAIALNDIRITTNYNKSSPFSAIYSTVHEYGHGLFGHQISPELEYTPIFDDISYGLHESQSRLWENLIGRNMGFVKWLTPKINLLGGDYKHLTASEVYDQVNRVAPSLVRIEADELTYHYHILIRYEVEKDLLNCRVKVSDAVELWNGLYEKYLHIRPKKLSEGILQDIHWSIGAVGYFPSYSFGTILSSIIYEKMKEKLGSATDNVFKPGNISKIQNWLKENIHQYGGTYSYKDVSQKFTGKAISIEPWASYMANKFSKIYRP